MGEDAIGGTDVVRRGWSGHFLTIGTGWRRVVMTTVALGLVGCLVTSCGPPTPADERAWREARQRTVAAVLRAGRHNAPDQVRFFPYDPAYRVRTMVTAVQPPQPLTLVASDGSVRPAHRVGRIKVRLPDGEATLTLFRLDDLVPRDGEHLFLPFADAAAGRQTYGAGRYLDVQSRPGGVVDLDFNRAYNPDCAYGITAQCPLTPAENVLAFPVRAGERLPAPAASH